MTTTGTPQAFLEARDEIFDLFLESDEGRRKYQEAYPIIPADAPGMPWPGPDIIRDAEDILATFADRDLAAIGRDTPKVLVASKGKQGGRRIEPAHWGMRLVTKRLLYDPWATLNVDVKLARVQARCVPGHVWQRNVDKDDFVYGPSSSRVMVIGKHPGKEEADQVRNFVGPSGRELERALALAGIEQDSWIQWYICNLVRHQNLDPTGAGNLPQSWCDDGTYLINQEMRLIKPDFILCLGSEAVKGLLGRKTNVKNMTGRVVEHKYWVPVGDTAQDEPDFAKWQYEEHTSLVMTVPHPAYVFHKPEVIEDIADGLRKFNDVVGGATVADAESTIQRQVLFKDNSLITLFNEILEGRDNERAVDIYGRCDPGTIGTYREHPIRIAWDLEWHGQHWEDSNAYVRTIQLSWAHQTAVTIPICSQGGWPYFRPSVGDVRREVMRLLMGRKVLKSHPKAKQQYERWEREYRARIANPYFDHRRHDPLFTQHGGQFFKADIPWARHHLGIDFRPVWATPLDGRMRLVKRPVTPTPEDPEVTPETFETVRWHEPWELTDVEGGFDTGMMAHAVFEATDKNGFKLEVLATRFTTCPRYDADLQAWKDKVCKVLKMKDLELEGYGDCPDDVLYPYGSYDADVTWRLQQLFNTTGYKDPNGRSYGFLDRDFLKLNSRKSYWLNLVSEPAFAEMEANGVLIDKARGQEMIELFERTNGKMLETLQGPRSAGGTDWPTFNVNSVHQRRELLYRPEWNGAKNKRLGGFRRLRPPGAVSLDLMPIKSSGKQSQPWDRVLERNQETMVFPSTDKESLGILANDPQYPQEARDLVRLVRDTSFITRVLQTNLRPAPTDKAGVYLRKPAFDRYEDDDEDADGDFEYDGGLMYYCAEDGRVRTSFYPIETGRCSSSRPPLQNISKRREDDYKRIVDKHLGAGEYKYPIRSMIRARPGYVLMEADLKSAELAGMAWMSTDANMIADVSRNMLPEDHPDYLDLHAKTAVTAFRLDCAWSKKALADIGKPGLRVAAKNVNFGVPYQRGAPAIARQCREEGAMVSDKEAQTLIDAYFQGYPMTAPFLEECKARVSEPQWIMGSLGRLRRFPKTSDPKVLADMQRSACNYPIQNLVGDAMRIAMMNLMQYRRKHAGPTRWFYPLLQIHDALLLEVPYASIEWVWEEVLPNCMCLDVPITPRSLDGKRALVSTPYHFGIDRDIFHWWGIKLYEGDPDTAEIPSQYLKKRKKVA